MQRHSTTEALVKTLAHTIAEVEAKTIEDPLDKEEGKALIFVLAETFAEADAKHYLTYRAMWNLRQWSKRCYLRQKK